MGENQTLKRFVGKSSLYLFYHHLHKSPLSYSVYKTDLDLNASSLAPAKLSPILELLKDEQYPTEMRCAHLGSKLYFLGGIRRDLLKDGDDCNAILPRGVYELDVVTNNFKLMDASLNTGKPDPCIFAANGKLYVLTSTLLVHIPYQDLSRISNLLSSIDLFECYDPIANEWKALRTPPVQRKVHWTGCTVLEKRGQVLLLGREPSRGKTVRFVYHVKNDTWTRYDLINPNVILLDAATDDDFYYGLSSFGGGPMKSKSDIISCDEEMELDCGGDSVGEDGLVQVSIHGEESGNNTLTQQPYFGDTTRFVRYIGNGCFCYIAAGMLPHPDHDPLGDCPADERTRAITIVLFKEIKTQGDCFQVEIIASQDYVMPATFYNMAELVECIVVKNEHKPKRKKNKKKKKNKTVGDGVPV